MAKMQKLTFKKSPKPTGLAAIGSPHADTYIKIGKCWVGNIIGPTWMTHRQGEDKWRIRFIVNNSTSNCGWSWVTLKAKFETEEEARNFIRKFDEKIQTNYDIHKDIEVPE